MKKVKRVVLGEGDAFISTTRFWIALTDKNNGMIEFKKRLHGKKIRLIAEVIE